MPARRDTAGCPSSGSSETFIPRASAASRTSPCIFRSRCHAQAHTAANGNPSAKTTAARPTTLSDILFLLSPRAFRACITFQLADCKSRYAGSPADVPRRLRQLLDLHVLVDRIARAGNLRMKLAARDNAESFRRASRRICISVARRPLRFQCTACVELGYRSVFAERSLINALRVRKREQISLHSDRRDNAF